MYFIPCSFFEALIFTILLYIDHTHFLLPHHPFPFVNMGFSVARRKTLATMMDKRDVQAAFGEFVLFYVDF
jgi:hypothetical protein